MLELILYRQSPYTSSTYIRNEGRLETLDYMADNSTAYYVARRVLQIAGVDFEANETTVNPETYDQE